MNCVCTTKFYLFFDFSNYSPYPLLFLISLSLSLFVLLVALLLLIPSLLLHCSHWFCCNAQLTIVCFDSVITIVVCAFVVHNKDDYDHPNTSIYYPKLSENASHDETYMLNPLISGSSNNKDDDRTLDLRDDNNNCLGRWLWHKPVVHIYRHEFWCKVIL